MIGISLGDVTGVGPEVTLKALAAEAPADSARYLLIGDAARLRRLNQELALNLPLQDFTTPQAAGNFFLCNPVLAPLPYDLTPGSPAAARAAVAWLADGAERCLRHELA